MKRFTYLLLAVVLSCSPAKKKGTVLNNDNVVKELRAYAASNPENEVLLETTLGNIRIRLYDETPLHRANFVKHVKEGTYDENKTTFYRVFYQFMIQGGIFPKELPYTIPAEHHPNLIHKKGALSMAQADENNPERRSSATEFFIVHGAPYTDYQVENDEANFKLKLSAEQKKVYMTQGGYMSLDQHYTVFGEVVEGLDVVDKIASVKVYEQDKPMKEITCKVSLNTRAN